MDDELRLHWLTNEALRLCGWMESCAKSPAECAEALKALVDRVYNDDLCNDSCKAMYFCDHPKGHEGRHGCIPTGDGRMSLGWGRSCLECGVGTYEKKKRPGRMTYYKGLELELPADLVLEECTHCQALLFNEADANKMDIALEIIYRGAT